MENSPSEAKEIFFRYGCSHYMMWHEGEIKRYLSFEVPKELEQLWVNEYQRHMFANMETTDNPEVFQSCVSAIGSTLSMYGDNGTLTTLTELIERKLESLDSFSKLLIAEHLLRIIASLSKQKNIGLPVTNANTLASIILKQVVQNPITIAPVYRAQEHLAETLKHDKLLFRAEKAVRRCVDSIRSDCM